MSNEYYSPEVGAAITIAMIILSVSIFCYYMKKYIAPEPV